MLKILSKEREEQLESLETVTETTRRELAEIITTLNWTDESILNNNEHIVTCPFDSSHRIPEQSLEHHLETCQWKAEGYVEQDIPLSDPILPSNAPTNIKFDEQLINDVLRKAKEQNPSMRIESYECYTWAGARYILFRAGNRLISRTSDRLIADFTSDERKAIYEYVITNSVKPDIGDDIADMNKATSRSDDTKRISFLELLAQERNLKRRRTKHRGVHTNKKSHIEILREVINQQMEMYVEYISDQRDHRSSVEIEHDFLSSDFDNNQQQCAKDRSDRLKISSTKNDDHFNWDKNDRRSSDFNSKRQHFKAVEKNAFELEGEPSTSDYRIERSRDGRRKREETSGHATGKRRDRDNSREIISSDKRREKRETTDQMYRNKHKYRPREERHSKSRHGSYDGNKSRDRRDYRHDDRRLKIRKKNRVQETYD